MSESGNYWLGSDKIYKITQQKDYQMRKSIRHDPDGSATFRDKCSGFIVDNSDDGYTQTITDCQNQAGIVIML